MDGIARIKYLRVSPKKSKLVMDTIRGRTVQEAEEILVLTHKKPARYAYKALQSAVDSYKNKSGGGEISKDNIYVKQAKVDRGPGWRILRPGFRGVPAIVRRRTSHFTIIVGGK